MAGIPGIIHIYHSKRTLPLFVYSPNKNTSPTPDILLFIGGMFDALTATPYVNTLAEYLSSSSSSGGASPPKWTVMHPLLSSSARQFGISSLDQDVDEIASAIRYIRSTPALGTPASRIVLMGHSTGCQDVLHYITAPTRSNNRASRPPIQGAILQAPVSDRDGILRAIATGGAAERAAADECLRIAAATPADKHGATLLPLHLTRPFVGSVPMLVSRWLSLASPSSPDQPADDDKFSFDLPPAVLARTFGQLGPPLQPLPHPPSSSSLLVLMSGADECVVPGVDQAVLLDRWKRVVDDEAAPAAEINPASGLVASAKHNLAGDLFAQRWARQVDLPERVMTYLEEVVAGRSSNAVGQGVGEEAWERWRREKEALEREKKEHKGEDVDVVAAAAAGLKL